MTPLFHLTIMLCLTFTSIISSSSSAIAQAQDRDARLRLRPDDGPVASTASARGRDFPASINGTLFWDDGSTIATFTTDAEGTFAVSFAVPQTATGEHEVTANVGEVTASDTFTVTESDSGSDAPDEATPGANVNESPSTGPIPESIASAPLAYPDTICPASSGEGRKILVTNGNELAAALQDAQPGDVIQMAAGQYLGNFTLETDGTADAAITLCGPRTAVIDGGDIGNGYALHITSNYVTVRGILVRQSLKGVMLDGASHVTLEYLDVSLTGHEAIHLRAGSSDNVVRYDDVHDTGFKRDKFGEGIYLGSAVSNWGKYSDGAPDTSDRNRVIGNRIWNTTSESIDIKEGTTGGVIEGNIMDGSMLIGADSWVDVKGNGYTIRENVGTSSPMDGFQTHVINDLDWGQDNVFIGNTATVNGPGYGFSIHDADTSDNVVACDNTVSNAGKGFANVDCVENVEG